jgi:hypothetical protein
VLAKHLMLVKLGLTEGPSPEQIQAWSAAAAAAKAETAAADGAEDTPAAAEEEARKVELAAAAARAMEEDRAAALARGASEAASWPADFAAGDFCDYDDGAEAPVEVRKLAGVFARK